MTFKISKNWELTIYYYRAKWTLLMSLERWNNGNTWRLYILCWEFEFTNAYFGQDSESV